MINTPLEALAAIDERWQNLTIANDFVFCKTMLDADLCREVLEAILGVPVERIEYVGHQEELDATPERKSVRLDVYVRDEAGSVYNVEMQAVNTHELPQRSRYYHSLLTLDQLGRGKPYKSLGNAYVIFICGFDPFGLGWRVYSFENSCEGAEQLKLGDGAKTVFLAATAPRDAQNRESLNELLDYVSSGEVTGELSAKLANAVAGVLDNRKWRLEFMMLEVRDQLNFDRGEKLGREIGYAAGIEQGREEGFAEGAEHGRQEGFAEGAEQGRQEGFAEGAEQGRQEGFAKGAEHGRQEGFAQGAEQGRQEGFAEGAEHGRQEGLLEGVTHGEDKLSRLLSLLLAANKQAEVTLALSDAAQREELYRTYGIE